MSEIQAVPLTVIGGGPAGIMAAYTAAEAGVDVTLIDDNPLPGGQYYRQSPPEFKISNPIDAVSGRDDGLEIINKLPHPNIRTISNTLVWGVFDGHDLTLADSEHSFILRTDRVVLATGAYDRPLAFPGWTTPGILGAGAALRMVKSQWVLPGKRILLAGLGPLQLALADVLIKSGAEVVGIAEAANPYRNWAQLPKFWGNWDRIGEAIGYFKTLRKHKVPVWYDHAIVEADGQEQVEKAVIARLDRKGMPVQGTRIEFEVDAVCLGYGLLPSFQLALAFECQLRFDERLSWFLPVHDHTMETSQPGIFVAGDVTDIAGSKVALVEGQIAGLNAAYQLGAISEKALSEGSAPLYSKLKRKNRLADALQEIYAFRPGLSKLAREDTLLCRCEEVTFSQVQAAIEEGATDLHQVKLAARTGMGYCQGRFCSALIAPLIAEATGQPLSDLLPFTVRPPIQPIPLRILASAAMAKADQ